MVPERLPRSLLVVGAGAIGIEFASFYHDMGTEVTVVEALPRILPAEDEEIAALARKTFDKRGMHIHTAATVQSLEKRARRGHGGDRSRRRDALAGHGRARDPGGRHHRQRRGHRPRDHARGGREGPHRRRRVARHRASPVSTPSAMSSARRGWRTRRATRRSSASSTSPASKACSRSSRTNIPGLHVLPAADRQRRPHRSGGARQRARDAGRPLPLPGQRQGHRARRAGGIGEDHLRRRRPASCSART